MAVTRDLTVQVLEDTNVVKLSERQQALRAAIQRGEPKSLGVSIKLYFCRYSYFFNKLGLECCFLSGRLTAYVQVGQRL